MEVAHVRRKRGSADEACRKRGSTSWCAGRSSDVAVRGNLRGDGCRSTPARFNGRPRDTVGRGRRALGSHRATAGPLRPRRRPSRGCRGLNCHHAGCRQRRQAPRGLSADQLQGQEHRQCCWHVLRNGGMQRDRYRDGELQSPVGEDHRDKSQGLHVCPRYVQHHGARFDRQCCLARTPHQRLHGTRHRLHGCLRASYSLGGSGYTQGAGRGFRRGGHVQGTEHSDQLAHVQLHGSL